MEVAVSIFEEEASYSLDRRHLFCLSPIFWREFCRNENHLKSSECIARDRRVHLDHKSKNDHGHFTFLSIWQFTVRTNVRMSLNSFVALREPVAIKSKNTETKWSKNILLLIVWKFKGTDNILLQILA
jgi:hypothetical protein